MKSEAQVTPAGRVPGGLKSTLRDWLPRRARCGGPVRHEKNVRHVAVTEADSVKQTQIDSEVAQKSEVQMTPARETANGFRSSPQIRSSDAAEIAVSPAQH